MSQQSGNYTKDFKKAEQFVRKMMVDGLLKYLDTDVFEGNTANSYVEAYTQVTRIADDGDEGSLHFFNFYKKEIERFISKEKTKLENLDGEKLVDDFLKSVKKINTLVYWMSRIFTYLDRFFTRSKSLGTLCFNAMRIFKEKLFNIVKGKLFQQVNVMIKDDRNGKTESREKIKKIMKIIDDCDMPNPNIVKENINYVWAEKEPEQNQEHPTRNEHVYANEWYDKFFRDETTNFIKAKAQKDLIHMSAPEYINSSLQYLQEEDERKRLYINREFHAKIDAINTQFMVVNNAKQLADKETGFAKLFEDKRTDILKNGYILLHRDATDTSVSNISEYFNPYIRQRGKKLSENQEIYRDPIKLVPELIKLKKEMDELVINCFDNSRLFQDSKNKAFAHFMGKDIYAKQLSNYTDYCMKQLFKGKSDAQVESELDEIIGLFKCLNTKLTFFEQANIKLSDRLIKKRSLNQKYEEYLISKLKQESGQSNVNKMTSMIQDIEISKALNDEYKKQSKQGMPGGFPFACTVINSNAWEISQKTYATMKLPLYLKKCYEDFEAFYMKKHSSSYKLTWCLGLSELNVQLIYTQKRYLCVSPLPQVLCLLILEKRGKVSIETLASLLECSVDIILHDVPGLVYNKSFNPTGDANKGIILGNWDAKSKEFTAKTEIEINKNFTAPKVKISTAPMVVKKTEEEKKNIELEEAQVIRKQKENQLKASVTRIMKSRINVKTTHIWLINETARQIDSFNAQPQEIKEAIEKLIEQNIIKRSNQDRSCYEYVA